MDNLLYPDIPCESTSEEFTSISYPEQFGFYTKFPLSAVFVQALLSWPMDA